MLREIWYDFLRTEVSLAVAALHMTYNSVTVNCQSLIHNYQNDRCVMASMRLPNDPGFLHLRFNPKFATLNILERVGSTEDTDTADLRSV